MIRRFASAALVAVALFAAPVRAQEPAAPAPTEASAPAADPTQALRGSVQSLQDTGLPPRTPRAVWHVSAAYAFAWLSILGYAAMLARRFRRLRREAEALAA